MSPFLLTAEEKKAILIKEAKTDGAGQRRAGSQRRRAVGIGEREEKILALLEKEEEASVRRLSSLLFISEPTVRRDLCLLEKQGKLIRTHGGAVLRQEPLGRNLPLFRREKEDGEAKRVIAGKAVSLIRDGDVLMLDGSTTVLALLPHLAGRNNLVITSSARVAVTLASLRVRCFVCGGELMEDSLTFSGSYAEDFLRHFNADLCFFSVRAMSPDGILSDNAIEENNIRRTMMRQSRRSVLLLSAKKASLPPCANVLGDLSGIDTVISDSPIAHPAGAENVLFL